MTKSSSFAVTLSPRLSLGEGCYVCACLNRMLVFAPVRKHKVPPLRFASVGMTELLREGIAQAELPTSRAQNAREMGHPAQADREEFSGREEKDAGIGCLGPDCASGQGPHSSRKERD